MQESVGEGSKRAWHQALAYAIVGRRLAGLGTQSEPDVARLAGQLLDDLGVDGVAAAASSRGVEPWPHPVPADLMQGLGHAQFGAALAQLRRELGLDRPQGPPRVGSAQPVTARDRRLLDEVPPHHGT